ELANVFWDTVQERIKAKEYDQLEGNHDNIIAQARQMNSYSPYVSNSWYVDKALGLKKRGVSWTNYQRFGGSKNWVEEGKVKICHGFYSSGNHLDKHYQAMGG